MSNLRHLLEGLAGVHQEIESQDNAFTSYPIITVQRRVRTYHVESEYSDGEAWLDGRDGELEVVPETRSKLLTALFNDYQKPRHIPYYYQLVGFTDHWEHVQSFLTVRAAKAFMARKGHDYSELRIYVESGYYNPEWQKVQELLKRLPDILAILKECGDALEFYANPETYFGVSFLADEPAGEVMQDFHDTDLGVKPGKKAQDLLIKLNRLLPPEPLV